MERANVLQLIAVTYTEDAIGQQVPAETARTVFCTVSSVSASEWFEAGRNGLRPALRATVFAPDYNGEDLVELDGKRYGVYRTYLTDNEQVELYLEDKAGI